MKKILLAIGLLTTGTFLNSCVKTSFDTPPNASQLDPNVPVNLTVAQLSNIALSMQSDQYRLMGDSTIYGIVTADDRSGNFYKQIVIQDSTGGITIDMDQVDLYNDYPIDRKIYVLLKGLTIINYKGLPEIVGSVTNTTGAPVTVGIPSTLLPTYVVEGSYPNTVTPVQVRLLDVISNPNYYLNRLVQIENMEFDSSVVNVTYAPSVTSGVISSALAMYDCPYTGSVVLYNSAYATFQPALTSSGKGTLTGIYSIYDTPQFLIRDTSDVQLTGSRDCR